jgi:N-acetylmuramoyl-L-alanine amidase
LLRQGATGEAVRDLQSRLGAAGHESSSDRPGVFGSGTEAAVRSFQERRGLRVDGICGPQTWGSLVEAGYRLGDRLLYHTSPPLRGDDVAELQRRLGALGFDAGRVDGIFGEDTQGAVLEFQRNAGLTGDAVCGPATLAVLGRVRVRNEDPIPVAAVHERESLRHSPRTLHGRRVVVGQAGGLDALTDAVVRALAETGAQAIPLHHLDGSAQAQQANGVAADVFVGLVAADAGCATAYYAAHGFESQGGRRLAECIQKEVPSILGAEGRPPAGMALPVLRETKMPAVLCELGPPPALVSHGADLACAFTKALECWVSALDEV